MDYETLLRESDSLGLITKEKFLKYNNGRIKGNRIAIRKDLKTSTEKMCVLAEELGHHHTSTGNILDQSKISNRKQEYRARLWAYNRAVGLNGLIDAYKNGCKSRYEIAEFLNVTEEFLIEAIQCYKSKYGLYASVDNYTIYFEPLSVLELYK